METVAGIEIVQGEWTECYGTLPGCLREENLTLKIQPNTHSLTHSLKQYRAIQSPLSKTTRARRDNQIGKFGHNLLVSLEEVIPFARIDVQLKMTSPIVFHGIIQGS